MPSWAYPDPNDQALPRCATMPLREEETPRSRRRRDGDSPREKRRSHHKSTRRRSASRERDADRRDRDPTRSSLSARSSRQPDPVPELDRRANRSATDVRAKTSYPTFSKAHSREAVGALDETRRPSASSSKAADPPPKPADSPTKPANAPPSPPLTADNPDLGRNGNSGNMAREAKKLPKREPMASELSSIPGAFPEEERRATPSSGSASRPASTMIPENKSATDSQTTAVAPGQNGTAAADSRAEEAPTRPPSSAPPPPPPPPPLNGENVPRVDYLLKNGGLSAPVPKRLINAGPVVAAYNMYQSPGLVQQPQLEEYSRIFAPLHKRLDDYLHVLRNNGSVAVATGYKSVARRLLDKLSHVFARDISSQRCDCVMCQSTPRQTISDDEDSGVSWGEILEFVSGRRELPSWPPSFIKPGDGPGIRTRAPMQELDTDVPDEYRDHYVRQNQKTQRAVQSWLDRQPIVPSAPPEEADEDTLMFAMMTTLDPQQRDFFIALMHGQSSVSPSRAPTPAERPPSSSTALKRARKALKRLYRLSTSPRDSECAMYLLTNSHLHGMLATLAEINEAEWEILVSGRFDGFLWSGAEIQSPFPSPSRGPSRGATATPLSRSTTPYSTPSRGPTPLRNVLSPTPSNTAIAAGAASNWSPSPFSPGPVQIDEETEIQVLAEVERNLFNDMERFEDAFEILHSRAELVRQLLCQRSAGLAVQAQMRRGDYGEQPFTRLDTPNTDLEEDDGLGDVASLAPDDSASQISFNRRRHKERRARRTPAPVMEEDEAGYGGERERHRARKR